MSIYIKCHRIGHSILLSNALENAFNAAVLSEHPWIKLRCGSVTHRTVVNETNSCTGKVTFVEGIPKTELA